MRQSVLHPAAVSACLLLLGAAYSAQAFASPPARGGLSVHSAASPPPTLGGDFRGRLGNNALDGGTRLDILSAEAPPSRSATALTLSVPRAGAFVADTLTKCKTSPAVAFDVMLVALSATAVSCKALERIAGGKKKDAVAAADEKPKAAKALQLKYLLAFWSLRCGYWMSGPYVFAAYASKAFDGVPASLALVSKIFLSGFLATALLGPSVGKATDQYGRKKGTLAFAALYAIGVLSVKSDLLWVLFAGRAVVGVALSLLFCAPESWLGGEASRLGLQGHLGETFSLAYEGDSIVAIAAGKLAGMAANAGGPTAPFDLSVLFLAAGAVLSGLCWKENCARDGANAAEPKKKSSSNEKSDEKSSGPTIADALGMIRKDPKLLCIGTVQSFFEAAMYVFILQWPPAMSEAVATAFGSDAVTPFGTIFSCFMSCSLLGSILFGQLNKRKVVSEDTTSIMLAFATLSMAGAAVAVGRPVVPFAGLLAAFFVYEACVGMYFPAMGTLRARLVPESHRSLILSVFGIPLNLMVVAIFLSIKQLGVSGALGVSAGGLALATASMVRLRSILKSEAA